MDLEALKGKLQETLSETKKQFGGQPRLDDIKKAASEMGQIMVEACLEGTTKPKTLGLFGGGVDTQQIMANMQEANGMVTAAINALVKIGCKSETVVNSLTSSATMTDRQIEASVRNDVTSSYDHAVSGGVRSKFEGNAKEIARDFEKGTQQRADYSQQEMNEIHHTSGNNVRKTSHSR